jgi:hypothetical protein
MVAGTRVPPSYIASLRAARILAAISKTRFLPSFLLPFPASYHVRYLFANAKILCGWPVRAIDGWPRYD